MAQVWQLTHTTKTGRVSCLLGLGTSRITAKGERCASSLETGTSPAPSPGTLEGVPGRPEAHGHFSSYRGQEKNQNKSLWNISMPTLGESISPNILVLIIFKDVFLSHNTSSCGFFLEFRL